MVNNKSNRVWNGNTCKCEASESGNCKPKGWWIVKVRSNCFMFKTEKKAKAYLAGPAPSTAGDASPEEADAAGETNEKNRN